MKRILKRILALISVFLIFAVSLAALLIYHQPMKDQSFNLSLLAEDGQTTPVDSKGWTVYTYNRGQKKILEGNGFGAYFSLDYPGQTFYFSRILNEELDSPTIRISAVNCSVSVFLDNSLLYTDFPQLEQTIGELELPMQEEDRNDPITLTLPSDYHNHTLTIAQSSPLQSELQSIDSLTVFPCDVTLYCGYSYESALISKASHILIPASLFFALGTVLLILYLRNAFTDHIYTGLLIFAISAMLKMCSTLVKAPFFSHYLGELPWDLHSLFFHLSITALLLFMTTRSTTLFRPVSGCITLIQLTYIFCRITPDSPLLAPVSFYSLSAAFFLCFAQWKTGNLFFKRFSVTSLAVLGGFAVILLLSLAFSYITAADFLKTLAADLQNNNFVLSIQILFLLCFLSCIITLTIEIFEQEALKKTELSLVKARSQLAMESYRNLCQQSEELMMIRHDTAKHYMVLSTMAKEAPEQLPGYIQELIGQLQSVPAVIKTRNSMLNIIINGKIGIAASKGIKIEIIRSDAPETLPLSDTELCSLVINILDNALNAISELPENQAYIKIDLHCAKSYFLFTCENPYKKQEKSMKKTVLPGHGYGLKIIYRIMEKWGNMITVSATENHFKISVALPLFPPSE